MEPVDLIFATNNMHKVAEIRAILPPTLQVRSLTEAGIIKDIPELFHTLDENSLEKARIIHEMTGMHCFSEDTGLEVDSLGGEPGVHSARYAGVGRSAVENTRLLLERLKDKKDRAAQFRTVITLIWDSRVVQFEGVCKGHIVEKPKGDLGFGYDPIFIPEQETRTFAEMDLSEKNRFSHRRKAMDRLIKYLNELIVNDK